jgi:hypothetical protein
MSAVHNIRMVDVARAIGVPTTFGQSPFAIARGKDFEASLLAREGARLMEALKEHEVLPGGAEGFLDLRLRMNGGPRVPDLDSALAETGALLGALSTGAVSPCLVAGATVRIPRGVMLPEAILIIDVLVLRTDLTTPRVVVGEIKAYPDLAGYTDPSELAWARAQSGLYAHALQVVIDELDLTGALEVAMDGFLVLTRPGSAFPSIRAHEDLKYQAMRAARGFDLLERAAHVLPTVVGDEDGPTDDDLVQAVVGAEHAYSETCVSFCDLAPRCHEEATKRGDAVVLGDDMRRFVGGVPLDRVGELLDGARPVDVTEVDLLRRLHDLDAVEAL